jgi:hypothetical protein
VLLVSSDRFPWRRRPSRYAVAPRTRPALAVLFGFGRTNPISESIGVLTTFPASGSSNQHRSPETGETKPHATAFEPQKSSEFPSSSSLTVAFAVPTRYRRLHRFLLRAYRFGCPSERVRQVGKK